MKPIDKLKKFTDCIAAGENRKLPLNTQRVIQDMQDTIRGGHAFETINQDASEVAKIAGLTVREKGIGWRITAE